MVLGNRILVVLWDVDEKVLEVLWDVEEKVLDVLKVRREEGPGSVMDRREEGAGSAMVLILLCYFQVPNPIAPSVLILVGRVNRFRGVNRIEHRNMVLCLIKH